MNMNIDDVDSLGVHGDYDDVDGNANVDLDDDDDMCQECDEVQNSGSRT